MTSANNPQARPAKPKYIVIAGCGRLGSLVGSKLSTLGHSVVMIDLRQEAFDVLPVEFTGFKILGDVSQRSILNQAKISQADVFWALTNDDNLNLMLAQSAKKFFGVDKVIARIFDPAKEKIFNNSDFLAICPTSLAAEKAFLLFSENLDPHQPEASEKT